MNIVFHTTALNLAFTALILAFTAWTANVEAFGETEFKETEVLSSRTLTKDKSPYLFNHDVLVRPEGELIVEPGVELRFAPEAGITVRGVFNAEGTPEEKIKFVSYEPIGKSFLIIVCGSCHNYSKFSNWRRILKLVLNFGCLFTFCYFLGQIY